jgi:hypothetical protein
MTILNKFFTFLDNSELFYKYAKITFLIWVVFVSTLILIHAFMHPELITFNL